MSESVKRYAVYLTVANGSEAIGTVVNVVLWDGISVWAPPQGQAAVVDYQGSYPIGSIYTPPEASIS